MLAEEIRWAGERVLFGGKRLGFLLAGGLDGVLQLRRFLLDVVPLARAALNRLEHLAERIPDADLREQAVCALTAKAYHVAGACVLATFLPSMARDHYVEIVAPLEAIYDFLDSLCDRHPDTPPQAFRQLHKALADALNPDGALHEYYLYGPHGDDGDYLRSLVRRVRRALRRLGGYGELIPQFQQAAALYADTQTFKHLAPQRREAACIQWHAKEGMRFGDLSWWEFGAACGSQFHVYGALYCAFCSRFDSIKRTYDAYFPALAALHVLLDSFIDQDEDHEHGELNWIDCYDAPKDFVERARVLAERARTGFCTLPMPSAHLFTLRIMSLFYLTHPKVAHQGLESQALALLDALA